MMIAVIIENKLGAGGGFDQALNALLQIKRLCKDRREIKVYALHKESIVVLSSLGIKAERIDKTWLDRVFIALGFLDLWWQLQARLKVISPFEKRLMKDKAALVYFVTPSSTPIAFQRLSYITTLWDLCHRDHPEFPEVSHDGEFFRRESLYRRLLPRAYLVIADSAELADKAAMWYGVDRDRFLPIPFSPSPLLKEEGSIGVEDIKKTYNLAQSYFYYPAQFWPHKNHIRILQAILRLRERYGVVAHVVFSGKDYGNLTYVLNFIKKSNLEAQVKILGFVPSGHVSVLYRSAVALVMPTYFGPTNLPPLEAWSLGVPVIYSSHLSNQVGDAAELADVDDPDSLARAMLAVLVDKRRNALIEAGKARLEKVQEQRLLQEEEFQRRLDRFFLRRVLWECFGIH